MSVAACVGPPVLAAVAVVALVSPARSADADAATETPATTGSVSALLYALPGQEDFGVGVGALNRGAMRLELRASYEAIDSGSLFIGRRWAGTARLPSKNGDDAGGDAWNYELTPMLGVAFGSLRAVVPALLASVGWRSLDLYVEAEYVLDLDDANANYFYTWNELGWSPSDAWRFGLVGQRTRLVSSGFSLQRGLFGQFVTGPATWSAYVFNPWTADHYVVVGVSIAF